MDRLCRVVGVGLPCTFAAAVREIATRGPVKLAIVGSRDYPGLSIVTDLVNQLPADTTVVSGGARGVDRTAEEAARRRGLPEPIIHRPDYNTYGKAAPFVRNRLIARDCDLMVAFWDGKSRGTADVLKCAELLGKPTLKMGMD